MTDSTTRTEPRHHYEFDCGNCGERITALIPCEAAKAPARSSEQVIRDLLEIRADLRALIATLDAPNPQFALSTGIGTIDYRLALIPRELARL